MTAPPTGSLRLHDGRHYLTWERTFRAGIVDVWEAVTAADRLARWIGTWSGDPADGFVMFTMTAEGEDVLPARFDISACERPRLLRVDAGDDFGAWHLTLELAEGNGVTKLTMSQVIDDAAMIENTGPGWEYYLDRLVVAEDGGDPSEVAWDDYYPAQRAHYVTLAETIEPGVSARLDDPGTRGLV